MKVFSNFNTILALSMFALIALTIFIRPEKYEEMIEEEDQVNAIRQNYPGIIGAVTPPRAGPLHTNYAFPEFRPCGNPFTLIYEDGIETYNVPCKY